MAGVLVKMLKVHGQKAGLAVQWLVEIKSSLHEKEPDSREVFGRALNAVFSWLVALEIGWFTKKLEVLENIYPFHIDLSSSPMERSSSHFSLFLHSNGCKNCSVLSFGSLLNDPGPPPQRQCRDFSKSSQILSIPALALGKTAAAGLIVGHGISG